MASRRKQPAGVTAPPAQVPAQVIERETGAKLIHNPIRLCDIDHKGKAHLFCHRESSALVYDPGAEDSFMGKMVASLLGEGQQIPVEYCRDAADKVAYLVRGYQRIAAHWHIIERGLAPEHFSREMTIDAFEVVNASLQDLVVRSICDNEVRRSLSEEELFGAARQLLATGVSAQRAARALGLSPTTFARWHRRITHQGIQAHADANHIGQTDLDNLLEVAASHGRVTQVGQELAGVVAKVEGHIAKLRARATADGEIFDEAKHGIVKRYLKPQQVKEWIEAVKEGKPLSWADPDKQAADDDRSWICRLDTAEGTLTIGGLKRNLHKTTAEELGLFAFKLSRVAAQAEKWWKRKLAEEGIAAATARDDGESYLEFLEKHRADEAATKVRRAISLESGEDDPTHGRVTPRVETDLGGTIAVPAYDPMIDAVGVDTRRIDANQ